MAIDLPTPPRQTTYMPRLLRFGVDQRPVLGGPVFRSRRVGSRYAVDVKIPPLEDCAGDFLAALLQADAELEPVRLVWPQVELPDVGDVRVDGGGQTGTTLNVDGGEGEIPKGSFCSVEVAGRSYLYATTADADFGGDVALRISPMIRAAPADNAQVKFRDAVIEGWVQGDSIGWTLEMLVSHGISFTIEEAR